MTLAKQNNTLLEQINTLLPTLPAGLYLKKQTLMNEASIGQHFRHLIEFYQCIFNGLPTGKISYDDRKRDNKLETDLGYALEVIRGLQEQLTGLDSDLSLDLVASYSPDQVDQGDIHSSLYRELAYAMDHAIHHLAIVKIILNVEGVKIDPDLGVAPSTLRFRNRISYSD